MADIEIRRAHALGMAAARKAADRMADDLGRKYDLQGEWDGHVLRFERPGVTGTLTVGPRDLHLSLSLGFLLRAMKASIEEAVHRELEAVLGPPPSEEDMARIAEKPNAAAGRKKASGSRKKAAP